LKGRDLVNGVPKEITINQAHVAEALSEPIGAIVEGVRIALENTAPEASAPSNARFCSRLVVLMRRAEGGQSMRPACAG